MPTPFTRVYFAALILLAGTVSLPAAEPEFVGVLALAIEPETVTKLDITPELKAKLLEVIDKREAAAVELTQEVKSLTGPEQKAKLEEFRKQSEAEGLALFAPEQRAKLEQMRLQKAGLETIVETGIAAKLNLSPEQTQSINDALTKRNTDLAKASVSQGKTIRIDADRKIKSILSPEQFQAWNAFAGMGDAPTGPIAPPAAGTAEKTPDGTGEKVAEGKTAEAKPTDNKTPTDPGRGGPPSPGGSSSSGSSRFGFGGGSSRSGFGSRDSGSSRSGGPPSGSSGGGQTAGSTTPNPKAVPLDNTPSPDGLIHFNCKFQPWKDVLEWFAKQADLSLMADATPPGTFNYQDTKGYTPAEALNLMNRILLTKGFVLQRFERTLMLIDINDTGLPPSYLVGRASPEELDKLGMSEIVSCDFHLTKLTPEEIEPEIKKLIGPNGNLIVLSKLNTLLVTETVARLKTIRDVIQNSENPANQGPRAEKVEIISLKNASQYDAMLIINKLYAVPIGGGASSDGTLKIVLPDAATKRILVSGKPDSITKLQKLIEVVDVPDPNKTNDVIETPQLEVYALGVGDPDMTMAVIQTLLAGRQDVRVSKDAKNTQLIVLAPQSVQNSVKATLQQLKSDGKQFAVIKLKVVDVTMAVQAINKTFADDPAGNGLKVEADPNTRQLIIRGTETQIAQVKDLMDQLGEKAPTMDDGSIANKGNVRTIPLTGRQAMQAVEQLERVWPTLRSNKIQTFTPSTGIRQLTPADDKEKKDKAEGPPTNAETPSVPQETPKVIKPARSETTKSANQPRFMFVADTKPATPNTPADVKPTAPKADPNAKPTKPGEKSNPGEGAPVIISVGPQGIMIASQDTEALDEMEKFLQDNFGGKNNTPEFTIFYLKHAKATVAGELLEAILSGNAAGSSNSGGGSLIGDLASAALGEGGGGLIGGLLGLGGGSSGGTTATKPSAATGTVEIVPDTRLNALFVRANSTDLDTIYQLLEKIDVPQAETNVFPGPRLIAVKHGNAETFATVVRQVFADRVQAAAGQGGQQRMPTPEEFMAAIRGGGRRGGQQGQQSGRGNNKEKDEIQKMTIGVDSRSNSLVVAAPDPLFEEVKSLVEELDQARSDMDEKVEIVHLKRVNPTAVQKALLATLGDTVTTTTPLTGIGAAGTTATLTNPNVTFFNGNQQLQQRRGVGGNLAGGTGVQFNPGQTGFGNTGGFQGGNLGGMQGGNFAGGNRGFTGGTGNTGGGRGGFQGNTGNTGGTRGGNTGGTRGGATGGAFQGGGATGGGNTGGGRTRGGGAS